MEHLSVARMCMYVLVSLVPFSRSFFQAVKIMMTITIMSSLLTAKKKKVFVCVALFVVVHSYQCCFCYCRGL